MSTSFRLPPAFHDPQWYGVKAPPKREGLKEMKHQNLDAWTVRLTFKQGRDARTGTGFFINIPDVDYHVILTAGHNLVDDDRMLSRGINVAFWNLHNNGNDGQKILEEHEVPEKDVYIPPDYMNNPREENAANDWGAVRLRKQVNEKGRGFSFSLQLSLSTLLRRELQLSGYTDGATASLLYSGKCRNEWPDQLEYKMITMGGLSGSPVFAAYHERPTVVAIHAYGPKRKGEGSRGTRLNLNLFRQVFGWAGVLHENMALKVFDNRPEQNGGNMYIRIVPGRDSARVRTGQDGLETTFDVFPAYCPLSGDDSPALYAFKYVQAASANLPEKGWVRWNVEQQRVCLTDQLEDSCLAEIRYGRKMRDAYSNVFRIVFPSKEKGSNMMELRVDTDRQRDEDIEAGDPDFPGISFAKYFEDNKRLVMENRKRVRDQGNNRISFHDFCLTRLDS